MSSTRIFLIRHAEAEGNIYRRAHGQFNGLLIGRAYAQIEQLRERFLHENIDAVYSSDLSRTCVTATALSETRGLEINTTKLLREVCVGEWEDVAWGNINHHFPEMSLLFNNDPARWSIARSEDFKSVRERMRQCVQDIATRHDGQTVAAFSHGFAIRALTCELMGIPSREINRVPYCDNTAVALLLYERGKFTIEYHRDASHLRSGTSTLDTQSWWRDEKKRISEELRYVPFDEDRDAELLALCDRDLRLRSSANIRLTALLENKPAGILELDTTRGCDDDIGWISRFFVRPEYCRRGFGAQLLGQSVSEYRKLRREKLCMEAVKSSPLMEFCKKYGFTVDDESGEICILEKNIRNW